MKFKYYWWISWGFSALGSAIYALVNIFWSLIKGKPDNTFLMLPLFFILMVLALKQFTKALSVE